MLKTLLNSVLLPSPPAFLFSLIPYRTAQQGIDKDGCSGP